MAVTKMKNKYMLYIKYYVARKHSETNDTRGHWKIQTMNFVQKDNHDSKQGWDEWCLCF